VDSIPAGKAPRSGADAVKASYLKYKRAAGFGDISSQVGLLLDTRA
jgi:hypothetical protein